MLFPHVICLGLTPMVNPVVKENDCAKATEV